jgi:biotin carboxyl carrier protein
MPHIGRAASLILLLLAFVLSFPDQSFLPVPSASHAQGLIRNLIARLRGETMPVGIVKANGLTEAAQVDVSSKYPGRLEEISVAEGTKVAIGQAIARVSSPEGEVTLVSPKNGEVQYLLAGRGDTIAGGESIVTIIDLTDIYMTVFLPAADASKLGIGDEARVILDAAPDYVIPAAVSFLASDTRISPKSVETKEERAKQTFRVDLRFDPQVLKTYHGRVEAGLRGAGFVRTKPDVKWPTELQIKLPPAPVAQEPSPAPAPLAQEQNSCLPYLRRSPKSQCLPRRPRQLPRRALPRQLRRSPRLLPRPRRLPKRPNQTRHHRRKRKSQGWRRLQRRSLWCLRARPRHRRSISRRPRPRRLPKHRHPLLRRSQRHQQRPALWSRGRW